MSTPKRNVVSALFVVSFFSAVFVFSAYFHVMLPASDIVVSDVNAQAYWMNEKHILLVWHNNVFIINPVDHWVGQPSDYRNRLLGRIIWPRTSKFVLWPRESYESVPIDDVVKRDGRDSFKFRGNKVEMRLHFSLHDTSPYVITVEFPNNLI